MADPFDNYASGLDSPASDWMDITLADADLSTMPRALDCIESGNVDIVSANGAEVTITLTAGVPYPCRPARVKAPSTGSAATGVVGLW